MASRRRAPFGGKTAFKQNDHGPAVLSTLLKQARKSGQLNLSNRTLSEVPQTVWRINLDVPEEGKTMALENADERWWEQVDLTKLILASNQLTELSEDIHQLPALTVLDVHDNVLVTLPEALGQLHYLQKLNISHNKLTELPDILVSLERLQVLQADHNQITSLGNGLWNLTNLESLDLSHNRIVEIPQSVGRLTCLMKLNLSNNNIQVLPHDVGFLIGLRSLDCTHNQIHTVPDELGNLHKLEQLYLRHNRLAHIPVLHSCASLKELQIGNNAIHGLTIEHLEAMQSVSMLDLRDNRISKLPDEITILQQLERLDISNNDLSTLPYSLGTLNSLKSVVLDGNPLKTIRRDIVMRGTTELKKYLLSRMEEHQTPTKVVKEQGGTSGIIGVSEDQGVDAHAVGSSKNLDYSEKKVSEIPGELWSLAEQSAVTAVNFSKNTLTDWPIKLVCVGGSLTELNLGFNKISTVDPSISALAKLTFLDLRNNQLKDLPDEMSSLQLLRELTLSTNRFNTIPSVVYRLSKLEVLLISDNQIQTIDPEAIRGMNQLATLDLQNNDLMQIPPQLGLCSQIRSLQLEGNPFRVPRVQILAKGTLALLAYLKDRIPT